MNTKGHLVIISGFSGAGKGTMVQKLIKEYDNFALSVSMTTRSPRVGEVDGVHYHFVSDAEFEKRIAENGMIEYAGYCSHYYGTPRAFVEEQMDQGKDVILEIEIQGAMKVRAQYPDALLLFVMPPSAKTLKDRLVGRGTETKEVIMQRLKRALEESEGIEQYDYIVVNDDLDEAVKKVNTIVEAAKNKPSYNADFITAMKGELDELLKGE